ncbi:MAG: MMPL family transporter [Desulfomonile tiedjei]|nr:MMPL family transporter [Desulfomonile tiedjei]
MQDRDKLDLSNKNRLDFVIDRRGPLVFAVVVITVILSLFIPKLQRDPTLESGVDKASEAYQQNQEFVKSFGNEEFVLIAIKDESGARDPRIVKAIGAITRELEGLRKLEEVVSVTNVKLFQEKGGVFGSYPVFPSTEDRGGSVDIERLDTMKKALPIMDLLVSPDLKTWGVLVRIQERYRLDEATVRGLLDEMNAIVKRHVPSGTTYRMVGAPLLRQAIIKYNVQTGIVFGILCMLIGTVVSVYVFRSIKVTVITNLILGVCVLWILGLMAMLEIPLNATTVLSFGFIPITTVEIVIHMVVRYHFFHETVQEKIGALKQAVRWLARPCLICTATTAVGFGTLMVSSIPMVRQLGFIMGVGVLLAYGLAMILTPAFFARMKVLDRSENRTVVRGWLDNFLGKLEQSIFRYHRVFVLIGLGMTVVLFAGTPLVRSDPQILRMLSDSTPVMKNLKFVEENLTAVSTLELMLEGKPGEFKDARVWERVAELDARLKTIPEVAGTDSLLPLLEYLNGILGGNAQSQQDLFTNPAKVPQLLALISMSPEGRRVTQRFLNDTFDRIHISIRIHNSPTVPIGRTIDRVQEAADAVMSGVAKPVVTGDLVVVAKQASGLITDQIRAMFLAAVGITALMVLQLGSPLLGFLCLIPNIPPVAAVFGIMGWFGIPLDAVTVFAASVAIGLAVDNTIHYLTQLKREIRYNPGKSIEDCVSQAYRLTARQISSWSTVTMLGFLALIVSPFRPVVFFGLLGCSSIVACLYGDLIFIQSLILSSPYIRKAIRNLIDREAAG